MDKTVKQFNTSDEDIALINRFTKRELTLDEVYTFSVILCDNEIDRDFERFSNDALTSLSELYIGKTGVFDHDAKGKNQHARIYQTELLVDNDKLTSLNEPYTYVKAKAYMVKSEGNHELMLEIDGGIKKEVSVSCSVSSTTCSICGEDVSTACSHKRGKKYQNAICHYILDDVTDVYEWSFVAVPAQKNAGVTKSFKGSEVEQLTDKNRNLVELCKAFSSPEGEFITISKSEAVRLSNEINTLKSLAKTGEEYRADLCCEVKRMSYLVDGALPTSVVGTVLEKLDLSELKAFKKSYEQKLDKLTANVQLMPATEHEPTKQNQFKI